MIHYSQTTDLPSCRKRLVGGMAECMREMAFSGHTVSAETLKQFGYPDDVIARFGQEAVGLARRRSTRQVGEHQGPADLAPGKASGTKNSRRRSTRQVGA